MVVPYHFGSGYGFRATWSIYPGMLCWCLWCQFDVILSSFCWRVDVNLMSNFWSNFTSIFTSNVYAKIDVTSIIWPKFDLRLTSIWRDIDVISTSFRRHQWCYRWRHLDIKTLTSFWWWNLWSILTSIFTSNVNENIDVTSIIWPEFDLILTSEVWLL